MAVELSEFYGILSSSSRTDITLSCIAIILLKAISINVGKNNIVSTSKSLIVLFKYLKTPFI